MPEVPSKSLPRPPKKPLREQSDSRSRERRGGGGGGLEVVVEGGGQKRSHSHGDDLEVRSHRSLLFVNALDMAWQQCFTVSGSEASPPTTTANKLRTPKSLVRSRCLVRLAGAHSRLR